MQLFFLHRSLDGWYFRLREYCAGTSKNKHIDKERVENGRSNNQGTWPDFCESMHGELLERMYTARVFSVGYPVGYFLS